MSAAAWTVTRGVYAIATHAFSAASQGAKVGGPVSSGSRRRVWDWMRPESISPKLTWFSRCNSGPRSLNEVTE